MQRMAQSMSKLNQATLQTVPDAIVDALKANYASGFRFDMTYINLLASIAGVEIDVCTFSALRQIMFRRNDDVHFLIDGVASSANCNYIVNTAENFLEEFGCFEISELYKLCEESLNPNCIRNANDLRRFTHKYVAMGSIMWRHRLAVTELSGLPALVFGQYSKS